MWEKGMQEPSLSINSLELNIINAPWNGTLGYYLGLEVAMGGNFLLLLGSNWDVHHDSLDMKFCYGYKVDYFGILETSNGGL